MVQANRGPRVGSGRELAPFTNNKQNGLSYDAAGYLTFSGAIVYDATGQQVAYPGGNIAHKYDGDRLRAKKVEGNTATYYSRSSVLGGQVVAEINGSGNWSRGYVYLGSQLLAKQSNAAVTRVHQEPFTKGQRFTDSSGAMTSTVVEVDPFGGETYRNANSAFQPQIRRVGSRQKS